MKVDIFNWKYLQELNKMAFKKNTDNGEFS